MKKLPVYLKQYFLLATLLLIAFQSCQKEDDNNPNLPETQERGSIIKSKSIVTFTLNEVQQILIAANAQVPLTMPYGVEISSINYYTVDEKGDVAVASGAIFIPTRTDNMPILSIQHGTETKRDLVASVSHSNSTEGLVGLIAASMGYLTIVPDYLGFGISSVMHPYIHAESLTPSVIDFIRACKSYSTNNQISLNGKLFLMGYSEGGYATLATQKVIEEKYASEFNLTAIAPLAGPYDLKGMTDSIFQASSYNSPAYIAFFLTAYNEIYEWNRLDDFFKTPYSSMMSGLFNGTNSWGHIVNQLPSLLSDLMNPDFISDYNNGEELDFLAAIQENTLLDWTPETPIHFFHGDADNIVQYQNALTAINKFTSNGANNIQLTTIPGGNHETSGPYAIVGALSWFEGL